ncbi:unnamed protein product [Vicia faba]|uniref:Uncharacterized protein n=1 Tax=Vicia faba TaxID=3906 RepID=A0AAV1A7Q8_VICFA|nr:unnamed protein product [Vicia faba]
MGKKPQKTKEVWAAIAEASTTIDEQQPQTSRKRGRPRKIVVKEESSEEQKEADSIGNNNNTREDSMEKEEKNEETCMVRKEEEIQVPKGVVSCRSSRARRKSKPTKIDQKRDLMRNRLGPGTLKSSKSV